MGYNYQTKFWYWCCTYGIGSYPLGMVGSKKKVSKQNPSEEESAVSTSELEVDPESSMEAKESDVTLQLAQQGQMLARMMERLEAMQVAQASMADELARVRVVHTVGRGVADVVGLPASGHQNEVTASHADGGNIMDSGAASHVDGGNREMNSGASSHGGISGSAGAGGGVRVVDIVAASRGIGGINDGGNARTVSGKRASADEAGVGVGQRERGGGTHHRDREAVARRIRGRRRYSNSSAGGNSDSDENDGDDDGGSIHTYGGTKLPKMPVKMKEFSGETKNQNVQSWVDQLTTVQDITGWSDEIMIKHCAMLLSGTAQQWYLTSGRDYRSSWKRFSRELVKKFTLEINPWLTTRYTENIKQKREETCRDFMDRVRKELRALNIDSEERLCEVFMTGCHDGIGAGIIRSVGRDAVDAKHLEEIAVRLEMAERMEKKKGGGYVGGAGGGGAVPTGNRTYTSGERIQLRQEGRCFNCGKRGHLSKECPNNADGGAGKGHGGGNGVKSNDHEKGWLPAEEWKKSLKCSLCHQTGHTDKYCQKSKANGSARTTASGSTAQSQGKGSIRTVTSTRQSKDDDDDDDDDDNDEFEDDGDSIRRDDDDSDSEYLGRLSVVHTTAGGKCKLNTEQDTFSVMSSIYEIPLEGVIDTGATRSCISAEMFNKMGEKARQHMTTTKNKRHLETANGGRLEVVGTVTLPMQLKSVGGIREMDVEMVIVRGLSVPFLLGIDFLIKYGAGLFWGQGQRRLTLKNGDHIPLVGAETCGLAKHKKKHKKERINLIRLNQDVVVKAASMMAIPGAYAYHCDDGARDSDNGAGNGDDMWSTWMAQGNEQLAQDGLLMAASIHDMPEQGKTKRKKELVLQLTNTTSNDVTYKRGQVIGHVEAVSIDTVKQQVQEQQDIETSADMHDSISKEIEEKIGQEQEYSALETSEQRDRIRSILLRFTHLFDNRQTGAARQTTGSGEVVTHHINTGAATPVRAHPYRQSPAMEAIINKEIDRLMSTGVVEHSHSPWASPIVMARKKDGGWRMCVDYRAVNRLTVPDVYPLPAIDQLLYNMSDAKVFTAMDLHSAYNQIVIAEEDQPKTAFIHRTGLYEYKRMPFGLRNGPPTFQRFMNMMLGSTDENMWVFVMVYLDDVIVFSATVDEHGIHLMKVLAIISRHGLKLKLSKCTFAQTRVEYLGHVVDGQGVRVDPGKVAAVRAMPFPTKVVELQSFLGMVGYYRRFIKGYSKIAHPLVALLQKGVMWEWTSACETAVNTFKQALTTAPVLAMPDYKRRFIVQTDASKAGIGAVLSQRFDADGDHDKDKDKDDIDNIKQVERPVAYISRTLKRHEVNYSATHLEMLAVVWAIKKLRHYILGTRFLLQTDHIALQSIRGTKELYTGRMGRWVLTLQEYEPFDVEYRRGVTNANADALSRLPLPDKSETEKQGSINTVTDEEREHKYDQPNDMTSTHNTDSTSDIDVQQLQQQDEAWKNIYKCVSMPDEECIWDNELRRECEQYVIIDALLYRRCLLNGKPQLDNLVMQLCLPKVMVPRVLREMHDEPYSGHLSTHKTWSKIFNRYYWKRMREDITHYCESCLVCAKRKVPRRTAGVPTLSPQLDWMEQYGPMECIAIDIIGPITTSNRASYILVIVDVYTRYGCAVPLLRQTTKNIVQALLHRWLVIHGMPRAIISDNGPGFASEVMRECMRAMGVRMRYVLPYHPESNGICERLNGTVVDMLSSYVQDTNEQDRWSDYLTHVVFGYNTATHESTGYTPYHLVYGREALIGSEPFLTQGRHAGAGAAAGSAAINYPAYVKGIQHDMRQAHQHLQQRVQQQVDRREDANDKHKSQATYEMGAKVMVYVLPKSGSNISKKLVSPYVGPCTVINQYNDVSYQVRVDGAKKLKKMMVHVTRMKRYIQRDKDLQEQASIQDSSIHGEQPTDRLPQVGDDRDNTVSGGTRGRRQTRKRWQTTDKTEGEKRQQQSSSNSPQEEGTLISRSRPGHIHVYSQDRQGDHEEEYEYEDGEVRE